MAQTDTISKRLPLGERIRSARAIAAISTTKLAQALDVDPRTVARWQSNDSRPSYERLLAIARALGQPPSYFLDDSVDGREDVLS